MNRTQSLRSAVTAAVISTVLWAGLAATAAHAEEPTPLALSLARELVIIKGGSAMFDTVIPGVIESVKNSFIPTNLNLGPQLNEVAAQLHKEYDQSKRAELVGVVARTYAEHFSEQELKDIVVFYKTPLGQKMIREEGAAIQQSLGRVQDWANALSETVMTRFRSEMQKKGYQL